MAGRSAPAPTTKADNMIKALGKKQKDDVQSILSNMMDILKLMKVDDDRSAPVRAQTAEQDHLEMSVRASNMLSPEAVLFDLEVRSALDMFAQDYDLGEEGSDAEADRVQDDDYDSSDDDVKRALRHIGGLDTKDHGMADEESDLEDFERSMEAQLLQTMAGIASRTLGIQSKPMPALPPTSGQKELMDLFRSSVSTLPSSSPSGSSNPEDSAPRGGVVNPDDESNVTQHSTKKSVKFSEAKTKFYDDAYFDSDDEAMDEPQNINKNLDDSEGPCAGGKKGKRKPHPVPSNTDLFYDPHMDEEDQAWVDEQRQQRTKPSPQSKMGNKNKNGSGAEAQKDEKLKRKTRSKRNDEESGAQTDAVLNCPCCMISICDDCQRHEIYKQQYRAMFVMNCYVDIAKTLVYKRPKNPPAKKDDPGTSAEEQGNLFRPVRCKECQTELGVYDHEEVYHFFNVIASHP